MPRHLIRVDLDLIYPPFLERMLDVLARCDARGSPMWWTSGTRFWAEQHQLRAAYLANGGAGLEDGNDGYDVEHALAHGRIGVCKALTDLLRNDTLTDRDACCPDVDGAGNPLPPLFVARHGGEARAVDKTRDEILKLASKKGR